MSNHFDDFLNSTIRDPSVNLVNKLPVDDVARIGEEARLGFERDWDSMKRRRQENRDIDDLYQMIRSKIEFPFEHASNVILPIINAVVNNYEARMVSNLFDIPEIVKSLVRHKSEENVERGERVQDYYNFHLNSNQVDFMSEIRRSAHNFFLHGQAVRKVFYDNFLERVVVRNVRPDDFVFAYHTTDLDSSYRYSQVLHKNFNELKIEEAHGLIENVGDIPFTFAEPDNSDHSKENQGLEDVQHDFTSTHHIIEQHAWIKLRESDEIRRPMKIIFERNSGTVFRISDNQDPNSKKFKPLKVFFNYTFFTNPNTLIGYGWGKLLLGLASGSNAIVNQMINAGTQATSITGLVNNRLFFGRKELIIKQGEFTNVNSEDIRKDFFPIEFKPPPSSLFSTLQLLMDQIDRFTTVTDLQVGILKSDVSATASQIADNNSNKQLTSAQSKFLIKFSEELRALQSFFLTYTDHETYTEITANESEQKSMTNQQKKDRMKADLALDLVIKPTADPRVVSGQQKLQDAQVMQQTLANSPLISQDLEINKAVTKKIVAALNLSDDSKNEFDRAYERIQDSLKQLQELPAQEQQIEAALASQGVSEIPG